jgi:hypothetical protein
VIYDKKRYMKVRGIVLDSKGLPSGKMVNPNASIVCTLLAGISPIYKNGSLQTIFDGPFSIRKRNSTTTRDVSASTDRTGRASFVSGSLASAEVFQDNDLPITLGQEQSYDWTTCRSGNRQGTNLYELDDGKVAVAIPGEPVVFIFGRKAPIGSSISSRTGNANSRSNSLTQDPWGGERPNRMDASRAGGVLYLLEIQYYLSIETGQVRSSCLMFVVLSFILFSHFFPLLLLLFLSLSLFQCHDIYLVN